MPFPSDLRNDIEFEPEEGQIFTFNERDRYDAKIFHGDKLKFIGFSSGCAGMVDVLNLRSDVRFSMAIRYLRDEDGNTFNTY